MPETKMCVCPQCGKKYKIPADFSAKSFQCKSCGATVPTEAKKAMPVSRRKRGASTSRARRGRGRGGRATPVAAGRRRGRSRQEEFDDEEEGGRGRYQKQSSSTNLVIAVVGLVVILGVVLFFVLGKDDSKGDEVAGVPPVTDVDTADRGKSPIPSDPPVKPTDDTPKPAAGDQTQPADTGDTTKPVEDEGTGGDAASAAKPARKLGDRGKRKGGLSRSKWNPPADLGHLEDTPEDLKKQIDEYIGLMMDVQAGRDSLDSKVKLAAIGKPAFPRILGAMAKIRDTLTDVDTIDERLIESSLKLADECLREMDGYLVSKGKQQIRPGTDKKYVAYILRLHYRRWVTVLSKMPEMPGPYDPTQDYVDEEADKGPGGR